MRTSIILVISALATAAQADDWPQWLGLNRDAIWREQGIVEAFPANGLPVKWRAPVSYGYGGPAVVADKVFVMDYHTDGDVKNNPGGVTELKGQERVLCFNAISGTTVWEHAYEQPYKISYAGGPRCTPTVQDGKVYSLGAQGRLTCLDADTGQLIWQKSLPETYRTETAIWGYASHPLVDGDLLYTLAGGEGSVCIALNKHTGEQVWSALTANEPGYNAPTMIEHAGAKQLLIWTPEGLNSLNPKTGHIYWTIELKPGFAMSIMGVRKLGKYLYASAIGNISALIELDDQEPAAKVVWRGNVKNSVFCSNSTPFLHDGTIYGCDVETGALMAVKMENGERLWQTTKPTDNSPRRSRHATAFIVKNGGRYFLFNELGDLIVADLSPEGYKELGRFHVLEPTNEAFGRDVVWSHPAFARRCMFARNDKELVCVDLSTDTKLGLQLREECLALMRTGDRSHETYEEALGKIERACKLVPNEPNFLVVKAWALCRTDRTDKAYMLLENVDELLKLPKWNDADVKRNVDAIRSLF